MTKQKSQPLEDWEVRGLLEQVDPKVLRDFLAMGTRPGRYEYWKGNDRQWYWRIVGANGEKLATSEGVRNKRDCLSTLRFVNVGDWPVVSGEE